MANTRQYSVGSKNNVDFTDQNKKRRVVQTYPPLFVPPESKQLRVRATLILTRRQN